MNLVVKSIPAQKLPKQRNSTHLCEMTLLEGNSPLLFQVIIVFIIIFKIGTSTGKNPDAKLGF